MASRSIGPAINGPGRRKCESWVESFIEHTSGLEASELYRKWAAITAIAATLEQKVWVDTGSGSPLYPNLYTFLIGEPGIGKSRSIMAASRLIRDALPEVHFGATSMTRASLSDHMNEAKRFLPNIPYAPIEYNSLVIMADEFSVLMDQYDTALVAALVEFYDVNPYSEGRRVSNIRIKVAKPQLTILTGSTPSNLLHTLKDYVWDQGLMSRVIMVYAEDRPLIDAFTEQNKGKPKELIYDLKLINALVGQFSYTEEFKKALNDWRTLGQVPIPDHPKLRHYCTRRFAHLLKLTMVSCVDRTNDLRLTVQDFNRAMAWLVEAERVMPSIFQVGAVAPDSRVMDEILYFIKQRKGGVPEHVIVNFARQKVSSYQIKSVLDTMQASRMIQSVGIDKFGMRVFIVP